MESAFTRLNFSFMLKGFTYLVLIVSAFKVFIKSFVCNNFFVFFFHFFTQKKTALFGGLNHF